MASAEGNQNVAELKAELLSKDAEIKRLQAELSKYVSREKGDSCLASTNGNTQTSVNSGGDGSTEKCTEEDGYKAPLTALTNTQISRYSRQLILPEIGVQGQLRLLQSSVLIVGAGGLGCPSAIYLVAAGIGRLGVVDYDKVEMSNLHRQILHTEARVNVAKAQSLTTACCQLNSSVEFTPYNLQLSSRNALDIIRKYDVVVDATDNVATRYLLNDACVLAGKPLVSGSALRFEGQLTVYNHKGGPCYRCLHPKPPSPDTVTNCSDGGVLGAVPGVIGTLQALEVVKLIIGAGDTYSGHLLLFYALDGSFRKINLRKAKRSECPVCGENPSITKLTDYEQFCGATADDKDNEKKLLPPDARITAAEYHQMATAGVPHVLVDVRTEVERDICQLPHPALNFPLTTLQNPHTQAACLEQLQEKVKDVGRETQDPLPVVLLCRRGNDSQTAVRFLQDKLRDASVKLVDIQGGLHAWTRQVDPNFPTY